MNEDAVKRWIIKAEHDFKAGKDEFESQEPATYTICFHTQQRVEKYLKAYLIFHNKEITKTHDIATLIRECAEIDSEFNSLFDLDIDELTEYAVEIRYVEYFYFPTIEETQDAIIKDDKVRHFVINKLIEKGYQLDINLY